jgi:hypothetical protein
MKETIYTANNIGGFFSANKNVVFLLPPIFLTVFLTATSIMTTITTVHASNGHDVNRFERGVRDGEEHPFSQDTYNECGDDYYKGFIKGYYCRR